jgi:hypothetical protein
MRRLAFDPQMKVAEPPDGIGYSCLTQWLSALADNVLSKAYDGAGRAS